MYFNGQRVARRDPSGSVFYYFTDLVHSSSVVTDSGGTIKAESDYYPWGGELQLVNNDTNHYKFSGKERDSESQLDFFGARYYGNALGRFVTPDWDGKPVTVPYAEFGDPQSLNLYSYVRNSPIARVDADGHMIVGFSGNGIFSAGRQGVDDGSGGLADGDNPYADADRALFVNAQGMFVVIAAASQTQPVSSVNILGNSVAVTYAKNTSLKDRQSASAKISSAASLINDNANKLNEREKAAIGNIKEINVDPTASRSSVDVKTGTFHANGGQLAEGAARFATDLAHDGYHIALWKAGKSYAGAQAEHDATYFQIGVGSKIGLSQTEINGLKSYADHIGNFKSYWNSPVTHSK